MTCFYMYVTCVCSMQNYSTCFYDDNYDCCIFNNKFSKKTKNSVKIPFRFNDKCIRDSRWCGVALLRIYSRIIKMIIKSKKCMEGCSVSSNFFVVLPGCWSSTSKEKKYLTGFVGAKEKAIKNMQGGIRCGMEEK